MTTATQLKPFTATFGSTVVTAKRWIGRFSVFTDRLLWEDTEDSALFAKALKALEESTGWNGNGGQTSLAGALMADWEPAHIFVAMNLTDLEKYANGECAFFRDAEHLLWDLMCLPKS